MAVRTIDCTACGSTVPYGRLSCPACGELLASVAGAMRPLRSVADVAEPRSVASPSQDPGGPLADLTPARPGWSDGPGSEPADRAGDRQPEPEPEPEPEAEPTAAEPEPPVAEPGPTAAIVEPTAAEPEPPVAGPERTGTDEEPDRSRDALGWPPAIEDARPGGSVPRWDGAPPPAWPPPIQSSGVGVAAAMPGAYLPPSPVPLGEAAAFASAAPARSDGPALPAPARAWAGLRADEPPAVGHDRSSVTDELRALTDPSKRDEMIGWLAVAGGTLASLGFLLPWSRVVIGSNGVGYFASWGFAGPGHLLVVVALLAVVALALVGVRVPVAIRLGAPGLFLGGLIIGVAWPYLVGPLGALPGVWLSLFGAATLTVASIAALVGTRHGGRAQDV
jgi:hypothetical protein